MASLSRREKAAIREALFARDGFRCRLRDDPGAGPCFGRLTAHHVIKASAGGGYSLPNLVTLCVGHNDWCEDHPAEARKRGLVRREGELADDPERAT